MEAIDPKTAQRVWERVTGGAAANRRENGKVLFLTCQETARMYQSLSQKLGGQTGERLRQLYEQERRCASALRGVCLLRGETVKPVPGTAPKEPPRRLLEICCRRAFRMAAECQLCSADPEFGMAFAELARRQRESGMTLLELLGQ